MKIAVSACLLGKACRFDGRSKPHAQALALKDRADVQVVPVCPECAGKLPIPRVPCEITQDGETLRVTAQDGADVTAQYVAGARATLDRIQRTGCSAAVMKAKSPSCGLGQVYDGTFTGTLRPGHGVATRLLLNAGVRVVDEAHIQDLFD